jgi:hypothetical protein
LVATAALLGATMLTMPMTTAWAQLSHRKSRPPLKPLRQKGETVEQRITALHAPMKITPDEETKWNGVA